MLKKVAEDIAAESGVKTAYYVCDVTVSSMVAETAEKIVRDFGRIDIAVNCAGGGTARREVASHNERQYKRPLLLLP